MTSPGDLQPVSSARRVMVQNDDPRAIRTRERLTEAYRCLVDEGIAPTSVSAVTARAQVNRSTFSAHFADLDELALYALDAFLVGLAERDTRIRASRSGAEAVRTSVLDFVTRVARDVEPTKNDLTARFLAAGVCGVVGMWLATEPGELSEDEVTDHLLTLLPASFL